MRHSATLIPLVDRREEAKEWRKKEEEGKEEEERKDGGRELTPINRSVYHLYQLGLTPSPPMVAVSGEELPRDLLEEAALNWIAHYEEEAAEAWEALHPQEEAKEVVHVEEEEDNTRQVYYTKGIVEARQPCEAPGVEEKRAGYWKTTTK